MGTEIDKLDKKGWYRVCQERGELIRKVFDAVMSEPEQGETGLVSESVHHIYNRLNDIEVARNELKAHREKYPFNDKFRINFFHVPRMVRVQRF